MSETTVWWCERCHASGLESLDGLGVYDAVLRLEDSHNRHALAQRIGCVFSTSTVRVQASDEAQSVPTPEARLK